MNKVSAKGSWNQFKGKLKSRWGKLTDDDLTEAEGNTEYLIGKLQSLYGSTRDEIRSALRKLGITN